MRASFPIVAFCIVASGAGATVLAEVPPPFRSPAAGASLEPGSTIEVAWQNPARPTAEEMELLLSVDGGRTFPIRLTRNLDPVVSAIRWRVPALPTPHARLALRQGESVDDDAETIVLVSDEFVIEVDPLASAERLFSSRGEWRTSEARDGTDAPAVGSSFEPGFPARTFGRAFGARLTTSPRPPAVSAPLARFDSRERCRSADRPVPGRDLSPDGASETPLRL